MKEYTPEEQLKSLMSELDRLKDYDLSDEVQDTLGEAVKYAEDMEEIISTEFGKGRQAAIYQVSQVFSTTLDLDEVLNQVMDAVIQVTGAERGFLMLLDSETGEMKPRAARNIEQETLESGDVEISETVINTVMESGEGVVSEDAQTDPRFSGQGSIVLFSLRSILCAPLRTHGETIGVIYVDNRAQSGIFTSEDLELLNPLVTQAAIAIENARLYTSTDRALTARVAELETLTQIDHELNAQLDIDHVVEITHRWAKNGTQADHSWLLISGDDSTMSVAPVKGGERKISLGDSLNESIFQTLNGITPLTFPPSGGVPARLVAPLHSAGKPVGALVVERRAAFPDSALKFLERLAGRAAAAIENALLYQAVQTANREKAKFVSVVTHELRIPMTSIKGYTDLLNQEAVGPINEQQRNFLGVIKNNVERMAALVSDLSDISRIETGRLVLKPDFVSVRESLDEVLDNFIHRLEEKDQTLKQEVASDLPDVYADPNRMVQVLNNLINNAWKYTPSGGIITIQAEKRDNFVRIEVSDNGIGISSEDQEQLFAQFFRSDVPVVREEQGWGLGLNVAKRLVILMGGDMGAQSELDEGSTFWFTLPTTKAES
jgi:signal transduction histidine kinase